MYNKDDKLKLMSFHDVDWGGDLKTKNFTSDFIFKIGNIPITWSNKKQKSM
jgi:hypothetical protein